MSCAQRVAFGSDGSITESRMFYKIAQKRESKVFGREGNIQNVKLVSIRPAIEETVIKETKNCGPVM